MEVMEDGNLMDKVHILIQRDMEYYKDKQSILQEKICRGIIGGRLDFPRSASFASVKLVLWWEEEYVAAFKKPSGFILETIKKSDNDTDSTDQECGGIVKDSDPSKFMSLISKSAEQLLGHLHILTQEALDHADLTVLTGTIGAAALLKNCIWYYIQTIDDKTKYQVEQLQKGYKKYDEMCEALAERLLDLHCRLLSLYILQDAECLDWEDTKPFFESERASYTIQMWWVYMQGTREDLWNTVPPKMAQRVFSGMLNESLTILTVRYTQSVPSEARSQLLIVDISNLLLCVAQLLPAVCDNAKELIGFSLNSCSKIIRDIHMKCQELLNCFLLRGAPLDIIHKVFKNGLDDIEMFKSKTSGPATWIIFAFPHIFKTTTKRFGKISELKDEIAISIELMVLLAQPQANWALLIKVLCMRKCKILELILQLANSQSDFEIQKPTIAPKLCNGFLCKGDGSCNDNLSSSLILNVTHYYNLVLSATEVLLFVGNTEEFEAVLLPAIIKQKHWPKCFERRHVWNQIRPPWYEAIITLVAPLLPITSETVINAMQTEASMYQAMALILACFSNFWDCIHSALPQVANILQEYIPADIIPLNHSCLLQILVSALYSHLLKKSECEHKEVRFSERSKKDTANRKVTSFDATNSTPEAIALAVAEALCSIDEDNKHTDQIEDLLEQVKGSEKKLEKETQGSHRVEVSQELAEILVSDLLMTSDGRNSLKTLYHFIKCNSEWFYQKFGVSEERNEVEANKAVEYQNRLLYLMFHIGYRPFDQLLNGKWQPQWYNLLQTPMGLTQERVLTQLSQRWEFRETISANLSSNQTYIINYLTALLKH